MCVRPGYRPKNGREPGHPALARTRHKVNFRADGDGNVPAGETLTHHAVLNRDNGVRTHVYRAPKRACPHCPLRDQCAPQPARPEWRRSITRLEEPAATTAFKIKMQTEEAKQIYAKRSQIAEFPHAWIKERCGLRQFRCRGRLKVAMEATWACLSYNLTRWFSLRRKLNLNPASA